jgi:CMP-2-keto-3-deoxyoctulosonic acid synthetase
MRPITSEKDFNNPNIVKVSPTKRGRALYFSRSPIPFRRNATECPVWEHLGIYAFTKEFLLKFVELPLLR